MSTDWTGLLPFLILAGGGTLTPVGAFWRRRARGCSLPCPGHRGSGGSRHLLRRPWSGLRDLLDLDSYFRFFTSVLMFITLITCSSCGSTASPTVCRG